MTGAGGRKAPSELGQRGPGGHLCLSNRDICCLLGIDVPRELEDDADRPHSFLSASLLTSGPGSAYFGGFERSYSPTIQALIDKGTTTFVTNIPLYDAVGSPLDCIVVDDPRDCFIRCCSYISSRFSAKRLAITGSVGKTTTKEMVQLVASSICETLYSKGNHNGIAQVGRYAQRLTDKTEVYVQETGAGRPGLVAEGARVLRPDAFIISNIGLNHVGNYGGSQESLLADKLSLDMYLPPNGVAFVNYDDPMLRDAEYRHRVISYAVDWPEMADYRAEGIVERDGVITFTAVESSTGLRLPIKIYAFGRHNVSNALAAFAVGRWLGVPGIDIAKGIARYRGTGLRQNLMEVDGRRVLVDCYNASEVAISSTADALATITPERGGRRLYVVADIDDKLGEFTEAVHRRVGRALGSRSEIDRLVFFGEHMGWAAEEAQKLGASVYHTTERESLRQHLAATAERNDVIAFKGGQQMALSITIDSLYGTSLVLLDGDVLRKRGRSRTLDGIEYRTIEGFGVELRRRSKGIDPKQVVVRDHVAGEPVRMIGKLAFFKSGITAIAMPTPVRTIATSAFYRAAELRQVILPESLRLIDRSAFNGCVSLREMDIPYGVNTIGKRAFYACTNLRRLRIPPSVHTIHEEAFARCPNLTIECVQESDIASHIGKVYPSVRLKYMDYPSESYSGAVASVGKEATSHE